MSSAAIALVRASIGNTAVQKVSRGADIIWSAFTAMGMNKNGTFAMESSTTALIGGWAVRTPGSVIANQALVCDGAAAVTIQWKITLTSMWPGAGAVTFRVLKNGNSIGTGSIPFNSSTGTFNPISTTVAPGDTLAIQYVTPFGYSATVAAGATSTYLYFEQAGGVTRSKT
ncbi:hypothetical protein [Nocardia sp. NPDC127526]|uniref:hypothetical protein n=1 Tax=Nocardia sp. NPDC127526 TaxID=3345393 RepID=UPI00364136D3